MVSGGFAVVPRSEWTEYGPLSVHKLQLPVRFVVDTDTGTSTCFSPYQCIGVLQRMQRQDRPRHDDIIYNFLISGDGLVYEGRGWGAMPLLPPVFSSVYAHSIVVAFIGRYSHGWTTIPKIMKKAWRDLIDFGVKNNKITQDFFHERLFKPLPFDNWKM